MDRLLITLCTYNERDNLPRLLHAIREAVPTADVLVVDDNSPDGTGALADEWSADDDRIHVMHRAEKRGLGSATLAAFLYGIDHHYALLVNMDADFSHSPERIPDLLALMERADVAIGSRYVPGGEIVGWKLIRHVMSRGVNCLTRALLGLTPKDTSGSFRCYRVSLLKQIDFARIVSTGYAFEEEILYRCRRLGARFAETPIRFVDRRAGESKINAWEVARALKDLAYLAIENWRSPARKVIPSEIPASAGRHD